MSAQLKNVLNLATRNRYQPTTQKTNNNFSIRGIERVTGCDNLVNEPFHINLGERKESPSGLRK